MHIDHPTLSQNDVGWLSRADMIEVDRVMMEDLNIGLIQMMENAGRNLAQLTIDLFTPANAIVLAGSGGNGGGGLVAARHLANRGVDVRVVLTKPPDELDAVPGHQLGILQRLGVAIDDGPGVGDLSSADVLVDGVIGYSLKGAPRGRALDLIEAINAATPPVIALDTPSGLDVDDGSVPGKAVEADATMTLALPKVGMRNSPNVGSLYVADISVPPSTYDPMNVGPAPDFSAATIVRVLAATVTDGPTA